LLTILEQKVDLVTWLWWLSPIS